MSEIGAPDDGEQELVHLDGRGPVSTITLDSPHNRNALSSRLLDELGTALDRVTADDETRVVILTGAGPVFCSGADLSERLAAADKPRGAPHLLPEVLRRMLTMPKPVIVRVNGHVRAGGIGLVAAADLAVAPSSATFAFTEVRVGVAPAIIGVPSLRQMTRRSFARYAMTGEEFNAHEARAAGLLSSTVDDAELDDWVSGVVDAFLRSSPAAIAATKELFELVWEQDWDMAIAAANRISEDLFAGPDAAEGMSAFLEKRLPSWVVEAP